MSDIQLKSQNIHQHTLVNNLFIDHYMPNANGDYVKVYLYLLRLVVSGTTDFTMGKVAKQMHLIRSDVLRAVNYWKEQKLIEVTYNGDEIASIGFLSLEKGPAALKQAPEPVPVPTPAPPKDTPKKAKVGGRPQYSMEEIVKYQDADEVKELLYIAQRYMGAKNLSSVDVNAIISFIEYYGLPVEVVEYLIEYCTSEGHTNVNYMEKVAIDWSDCSIRTVDQARAHTDQHGQTNKNYYRIFRSLGLSGRTPTPNQAKFMDKWINDYNFAIEVIETACEKTIKTINKPSLDYVDSILTGWHNKGVKSPEAIAELDRNFQTGKAKEQKASTGSTKRPKNRFINYEQHDYDYDDLEKKMKDLRKKKSNGA